MGERGSEPCMFSGKVSYTFSTAHLHEEQRTGGVVKGEERVNGTSFLFYRREKLRARSEKLGVFSPFPRY